MRFSTLLALSLTLAVGTLPAAADWTRFRGPGGSGIADGPAVPFEYSATHNLGWRVALPGKGVSSPVVHGDRVFATAYTGYGLDPEAPGNPDDLVRHLMAFDRWTGEEVWRVSVESSGDEDPYQGFMTQHGYASSTPVTDGKRIFALFGKSGLLAVDRDGNELWRRDLGRGSDRAGWGSASSPILADGVLVVNAGILDRRIVGLDPATGDTLWSLSDPNFTNSWSTPAVANNGETTTVLVHFPFRILGIDPRSGEVRWSAATPIDDATSPSIVTHDGVAYVVGSRAGHAMAVRLGGSGDVTESHVVWKQQVRAGITTPVIVGDALVWASRGIVLAHSLATGERILRERLPRVGAATGGFPNVDYSSPVAVGDRVLLFTRNGESYVFEVGSEFRLVAHNPPFAGDATAFSATPAMSQGELFMRSEGFLYRIADEATERERIAREGRNAADSAEAASVEASLAEADRREADRDESDRGKSDRGEPSQTESD